jgi:hypothetical protein
VSPIQPIEEEAVAARRVLAGALGRDPGEATLREFAREAAELIPPRPRLCPACGGELHIRAFDPFCCLVCRDDRGESAWLDLRRLEDPPGNDPVEAERVWLDRWVESEHRPVDD